MRITGLVIAFAVSGTAIASDTSQSRTICLDESSAAAARVSACTQGIESTAKADESTAQFYFARSRAFQEQGDIEAALRDSDKAIELAPNVAKHWAFRGWHRSLLKNKDSATYEEMVADYTDAIRLDPKKWMYFDHRAKTYKRLKKWELALADFDQSIAMYPTPSKLIEKLEFLIDIDPRERNYLKLAISLANELAKSSELTDRQRGRTLGARSLAHCYLGDNEGAYDDARRASRIDDVSFKAFVDFFDPDKMTGAKEGGRWNNALDERARLILGHHCPPKDS